MTTCTFCSTSNPGNARYCMECGRALPAPTEPAGDERPTVAGFSTFGLSILGSLAVSAILMYVFRLPVFLMFSFLPLFWWRRKK